VGNRVASLWYGKTWGCVFKRTGDQRRGFIVCKVHRCVCKTGLVPARSNICVVAFTGNKNLMYESLSLLDDNDTNCV
jgi:hypothetical protein